MTCFSGFRLRQTHSVNLWEAVMQRITVVFAALAALALSLPTAAQKAVTLNVVTAGDQNMVDYVKDYLGPMFEKEHPGVTVKAVGTGPGDAGSQKIYEKLEAEKPIPPGTSMLLSSIRRPLARWS